MFQTLRSLMEDLDEFIRPAEERLQQFAHRLGIEDMELFVEDQSVTIPCAIDPTHRISKGKEADHHERCSLQQMGYSKSQVRKILLPTSWFHEASGCSCQPIKLDLATCEKILQTHKPSLSNGEMPLTHDRYVAEFLPQERLELYDWVVAKGRSDYQTSTPSTSQQFDLTEEIARRKKLEKKKLGDMERESGRPRSHRRSKQIYRQKKTYTEILREVLDSQMETTWPSPLTHKSDHRRIKSRGDTKGKERSGK